MAVGASATRWARRHQLIHRQSAVSIFIQGFERGRSIGDLVGINDAVVVGIEGCDDRRGQPMRPGSGAARERIVATGSTGRGARTLAALLGWTVVILGNNEGCGGSQCQEGQGSFSHGFHKCLSVCLCGAPEPSRRAIGAAESSDSDDFLMFTPSL